jgi:GxxExxY protein
MALEVNQLTEKIIGAAMEVHRALGPGLLESAYEECLCYELGLLGIRYERQKVLPVVYKDHIVNTAYRLDLVVENQVVVELKAIDDILPIHDAQLITYLKLGGWKVGLIINFNVAVLKNGIHRKVLGLDERKISAVSAPSASLR